MSIWLQKTLSQAPLQIIDGDRGTNYPSKKDFSENGFCLFLNAGNVTLRGFVFSETTFIDEERDQLLRKGKLQREDVILTTRGTVGNVAYYGGDIDFDHVRINSGMVILRTIADQLDARFMYFFLRSHLFSNQVKALTTGSAQPQLPIRDMGRIAMPIPPIDEQFKIVLILSAIDDKIENNRRMNETLEEMARAIFKSWFVDFDPVHAKAAGNAPAHMDADTAAMFPSSFGDDGLPVGWEWCKLSNLVTLTKGRSYRSAELQDSDTALVSLKSFMRGGGYRPDGLKPYTGTYKDEQTLTSGDLIVALTDVTQAADVIGKPAIVRSNNAFKTLVASLDVGVVRPTVPSVSIPFLYCMMMTHDFQTHIYGHTSGTTVLHLGKQGVPTYEFGMPADEILDKFTTLAQPIFSKIEMNEANSKILAELRDTLNPKLMSGEIRVKDAERAVEAAV